MRGLIKTLESALQQTRSEMQTHEDKLRGLREDMKTLEAALLVARRQKSARLNPPSWDIKRRRRQGKSNVVGFVRSFVSQNWDLGVQARDILAAIRQEKLDVERGYVYTLLTRLRKSGEFIERDRRYYPRQEGPTLKALTGLSQKQ